MLKPKTIYMKKLTLILSGILSGFIGVAQISITGSSLSYLQDFNSLDTTNTNSANLPSGWEIKETGTSATTVNNQYKGNSGTGTTGDTYSYGNPGVAERALGSIASGSNKPSYGARFMNNTGAVISSFSLSYQGEQWRRGSTTLADSLVFSYSINADSLGDPAASWTVVNSLTLTSINLSTPTGTAIDGNVNTNTVSDIVPINLPTGAILTLKWSDVDVSGGDDGLALDDVSLTFTTSAPPTPNYHPVLISINPADNSSNLPASLDSLQLVFDRQIAIGAGDVMIQNETDKTMQTLTLSSANTTVSGFTATIKGMNLLPGKNYHILMDSTAFDTAGYVSAGIYDTTVWNFSTAAPTPSPTATGLNENFDTSCGANPTHLPMGWTAYSVAGLQQWDCIAYGRNTTPGVQMNGYSGGNNVNEDWLITPLLDLSAMPAAYLLFDHWKRFSSGDELAVLFSYDYSGAGDPNDATWTNLNMIAPSPADTGIWKHFEANITAPAAQPLYLAFQYLSTATEGYQSRLDNVLISATPDKVKAINKASGSFCVLGHSDGKEIMLSLKMKEGDYSLSVYDLSGRELYHTPIYIQASEQKIIVRDMNLASGMYFIKLGNKEGMETVKFIVR